MAGGKLQKPEVKTAEIRTKYQTRDITNTMQKFQLFQMFLRKVQHRTFLS
jgi:hypothetical protein